MKAASCLAAGLAVSAFIATDAVAHATPPVDTSAKVMARQSVDGMDYIVSEITNAPGGCTGWHTHQGEVYGLVKQGVLTHYGSDCRQDGQYGVGQAITDPSGANHVHIARNLGVTPVVLQVTYVNPAGGPTSESAPNPGCNFQ